MLKQVRVLRDGQITIPAEFRKILNLKEDDYITFKIINNQVSFSKSN